MLRLFIAISLPREIKQEIAKIEDTLKRCNTAAAWVNPENVHLTLKFLGNVSQALVPEIQTIIETVARQFTVFPVCLTDFGFFPSEKKPRVFFIKTDMELTFTAIYRALEEKLSDKGFPAENRFKSHLTLARFKSPQNIDRLKKELPKFILKQRFYVESIALFKSTLTKSGSIYEQLFTAALKA